MAVVGAALGFAVGWGRRAGAAARHPLVRRRVGLFRGVHRRAARRAGGPGAGRLAGPASRRADGRCRGRPHRPRVRGRGSCGRGGGRRRLADASAGQRQRPRAPAGALDPPAARHRSRPSPDVVELQTSKNTMPAVLSDGRRDDGRAVLAGSISSTIALTVALLVLRLPDRTNVLFEPSLGLTPAHTRNFTVAACRLHRLARAMTRRGAPPLPMPGRSAIASTGRARTEAGNRRQAPRVNHHGNRPIAHRSLSQGALRDGTAPRGHRSGDARCLLSPRQALYAAGERARQAGDEWRKAVCQSALIKGPSLRSG